MKKEIKNSLAVVLGALGFVLCTYSISLKLENSNSYLFIGLFGAILILGSGLYLEIKNK